MDDNNIDDEIVSFDDDALNEEEQSNIGVPSNSNKGNFTKNVRNGFNGNKKEEKPFNSRNTLQNQNNYEKQNTSTINRLNDIKNKKQGLNNPAASAGKEIGNELAGKSEEEKSGLEKGLDNVGGKASAAAVTAATGGAVSGPAAEAVGNAAFQLAKKNANRKFKMYAIIAGVFAFVILLFFAILASNDDDEIDTSTDKLSNFVTGSMTEDELNEYLINIGVCTENGDDYELTEEEEKQVYTADCKYAKEYFKKIKSIYDDFSEDCNIKYGGTTDNLNGTKHINQPCNVQLNIPLLQETLSYGKTNDELWNKRATEVPHERDIEELSRAMTEYVWESCYQMVDIYITPEGKTNDGPCQGCNPTGRQEKRYRNWYYFQLSFDKYVSFLKYGFSSSHPYYSSGIFESVDENLRKFQIWRSNDSNYIKFGENYDHECVGPQNDILNNSTT